MSEKKAYEALSSSSRRKILKVLHKKPLSVDEIAELVNLRSITVRHHLRSLEEAKFIESYEQKSGSVGRPKVYYRIAKEPTRVGYPKRRYLKLSNFLIKTLQKTMGTKSAQKIFNSVGENMGKNVIAALESKQGVKDWTLEDVKTFFIKEYLAEEGTETEIVEFDNHRIVYRSHNCLFLELALNMPETMCEVLHEAYHRGISSGMGDKIKITRLTCMGHGDQYCEHECVWLAS